MILKGKHTLKVNRVSHVACWHKGKARRSRKRLCFGGCFQVRLSQRYISGQGNNGLLQQQDCPTWQGNQSHTVQYQVPVSLAFPFYFTLYLMMTLKPESCHLLPTKMPDALCHTGLILTFSQLPGTGQLCTGWQNYL